MRILIVDTCYDAFLEAHYAAKPGLSRAPYAEQWRALMDTFFGTADSYSHHLGLLGHEAHEVVANCAPLQQAWAREHPARRVRVRRGRSPEELVVRQAEWFEPDVAYVQHLSFLRAETVARLREIAGFVAGQIATEPPPADRLRGYDLLVSSFPHFVERFRGLGIAAEYLPLAFDARVLDRLADAVPGRSGAVFVGSLAWSERWRSNEVLEAAARRTRIDFWGYGAESRPPDSPIRASHHGEAWGLEMFRTLREATLALNRHGDVADGFANNMRLFEATGVGTMLLTDGGANLAELYEPGREVETYADEDELVEKIEHFLAHDEERRAIARAGQQRTLRDHDYGTRMRQLATVLEAHRPR